MANDNKEITEIVKKCKILLLDIEGTTTSISFVKDKLFPYAEENVKQFLDSQWETDDVKEVVAALRKLALEDQEKSVDGVVAIPGEDASKEEQIEGLVNNVKWQMSSDRKEGALKQLQGLIWKQGYDSGDIKGHVYDDVSAALEQWHSVDGQKVYIYSSGSVQAQKLLFGQSQAGDLLRFIDGHFDTAVGAKQEATSYTTIAEKIGVQPSDVLFLTDVPKEGEAARDAGFHVALVSREGNAPLSAEATDAFAVLHSLAQLTASNKRKTEPQEEQPAKVLKTDTVIDVKTASDTAVPDVVVPEKKVQDEQEKMEVEESSLVQEKEDTIDETVLNAETVIEDVTDAIEPLDVPMVDVEPVVIEVDGEKSDICEKDVVMNTEVTEMMNTVKVDTRPDEVATKPESSTLSDEVETKLTEVASEPGEMVTKPEEDITKPDEEVTMSDEVLIKADEVVTKANEVVESIDVSSSNEIKKKPLEDAKPTESEPKIINDEQKEETLNSEDQLEGQSVKENAKVAEETPPAVITEIEEMAADNLGDVAEIIDDLEPIVEEPQNEDMEDLQNVGEVLEKECDEILSKVQDVTNLDNIPLKPLLNPIVEETMETEIDADNMDSNDIVDRILDTELELEMKQCNDIDLNTVSDITDDAKMEESVQTKLIDENNKVIEPNDKLEDEVTENVKEVSSAPKNMDAENECHTKRKPEDDLKNNDKVENNESKLNREKEENEDTIKSNDKIDYCDEIVNSDNVAGNLNMEIKDKLDKSDETNNEQNENTNDKAQSKDLSEKSDKLNNTVIMDDKIEETQVAKTEERKPQPSENNKDDLNTQQESTDTDMVSEEVTMDSEKDKESQVNGKAAANGEPETINVNGDVNNAEELNSRLSVENGKDSVNGSNENSVDAEKGQGDKVEAEVSDIKVKSVATEEPRTDPIEQPAEA